MERPTQFLGPVNLGNPGEFTMLELAELVQRLTGSNSPINFQPLPIDDPRLRRPVIDKAIEHLGWEPKVELADGIARMVAWSREADWANA
jgi:UDP-glucuronate decarboxylase